MQNKKLKKNCKKIVKKGGRTNGLAALVAQPVEAEVEMAESGVLDEGVRDRLRSGRPHLVGAQAEGAEAGRVAVEELADGAAAAVRDEVVGERELDKSRMGTLSCRWPARAARLVVRGFR